MHRQPTSGWHRRWRPSLSGSFSIGAGAFVAFALGAGSAILPNPFAVLFALSGLALLVSLGFWLLVDEPVEAVPTVRPDWRTYLRSVTDSLRSNRAFQRFLVVRALATFDGLALGFHSLFALQILNLRAKHYVGVFAAMQTAGMILGGILLGAISERLGNQRLIQVATAIGCLAPAITCLAAIRGGLGTLNPLYAVLFLTAGVFSASLFVGFNTLVVELAPASERATYLGLFNTLSGVGVILPMVGGWMLEKTSYELLFGATALLMLIAHAWSWRMPKVTDTSEVGRPANSA